MLLGVVGDIIFDFHDFRHGEIRVLPPPLGYAFADNIRIKLLTCSAFRSNAYTQMLLNF